MPQLFLWDNADLPEAAGGDGVAPGLSLADARPYQVRWVADTFAAWGLTPSCLGVGATGLGKTFYAAGLAQRIIDGGLDALVPGNHRAMLFINHREHLVRQAAASFQQLLPKTVVEVEQADNRARGDPTKVGVVVACVPSLTPDRLRALGRDRFQGVVWDEAHRYGKNHKVRQRVFDFFGGSVRHAGITATPDRGDGSGLADVYDRVAFEDGIDWGCDEGWLVRPYQAYEICGEVRLDGCPVGADGEYEPGAISSRMMEAGPIAAAVRAAIKWSNYANGRDGKRPTVVVCASVEHAKLIAIALNEWHRNKGTGRAAAVYGEQSFADREVAMQAFRKGELQYLTHFDVLSDGWDTDRPKVMVNARCMRSRWLYGQNAGRLVRPDAAIVPALNAAPDAPSRLALIAGSAKPGCVMVDVAGTDHKLTVSLADVFHGKNVPPAVIERAKAKARAAGDRATDVGELTREAAAELRAELKRQREEANAARWKGVLVDADLTTRFADPFDLFSIVPGREPNWHRGRRPTEPMRHRLTRAKIPTAEVNAMTFWQAKAMLDVIGRRRDEGLCTYGQARVLKQFGYDPNNITFKDAHRLIDGLARNGWCRPDDDADGN